MPEPAPALDIPISSAQPVPEQPAARRPIIRVKRPLHRRLPAELPPLTDEEAQAEEQRLAAAELLRRIQQEEQHSAEAMLLLLSLWDEYD